ncbi:MAG: pyrroline-5-carboxylate reductase [Opitutales bacterium]|nr:pyrroline-5-carboxylate reductase [Opitutales bacterium]
MHDQEKSFGVFFIGAGMMGGSMVRSLIRGNAFPPDQIGCCSAKDGTAEKLAAETGIAVVDFDAGHPPSTNVLVLACKPQQLSALSSTITGGFKDTLLVSILAGTPISKIRERFPTARAIVRAMPNTPGSIGAGITAWASDQTLQPNDATAVATVLGSLGDVIFTKESELDAVTAISGSGPAYLFLFTEALEKAARGFGFDEATALKLARQTIIGAAKLMDESPLHPSELRRQVTSPGGTTQAAVQSFEQGGLHDLVNKATQAAHARSIELSKL